MILRRELLQLGLGAGGTALLPLPLLAAKGSAHVPLFRLLHDARAPQSRRFAAALGQSLQGATQPAAPQQALPGDITRFWADELHAQWQQAPVALAGCTGADLLFCLEQVARDHRLRVHWRAAYPDAGSLPLVSWLIAAA